jgi:hypothetical protein
MPPKKRTPPTRYWVFRMNNGEEEVIHTKDEAEEYETENSDIIEQIFKFASKEAMTKHQNEAKKFKSNNASSPPKPTSVTPTPLTPEERIKLDRISAMIEQSRPTNKIELMFKTNSRATMAVVIITFRNEHGHHQWFCKPDIVAVTMCSYATHVPQDNEFVQKALQRMSYMRRRDTEKGPDHVKQVEWKPPKGGESKWYDQHIAFTYVDIPFRDLQSVEDEENYLLDNLTLLGNTIKKIMQSALFLDAYKNTLNSASMWKAMTEPKSGKNIMQYINDCKIKPMKCENINTYAVLEDTKSVTTFLFNTRHTERKYRLETPAQSDVNEEKKNENKDSGEENNDDNDISSDDGNHGSDEQDIINTRSRTNK